MRNILLIIFIVGIYGCKKCADCTRSYVIEVKKYDSETGEVIETYNYADTAKTQDEICGSSEIKDYEKQTIEFSYDSLPGFVVEKKKIGTTTCITK